MTMPAGEQELEVQTFDFEKEVMIDASIEITFEAALAELGPEGSMPDDQPFPFVIEPWPGGRWYRDLGESGGANAGHLWGHVQVIKPPKLIEIVGPCFLSYPATNHIQYRLTADGDHTRLRITNRAFGYMPKGFMTDVKQGWEHGLKRLAEIAARLKNDRQKFPPR